MSKFKKVLRKIAKKEGVSVKTVYCEMQKAIDIGFSNPDPSIQENWRNIPLPCEKPRPEDVIVYCAKKISRKI